LFGLTSNILAGTYKLYNLRLRRQTVDKKEGEGAVESKKIEAFVYPVVFLLQTNLLDSEYRSTLLQLTSDCADFCLPATSLGYLTLDDGALGLAGSMSSLIGLYNAWEKVRK
jgi:peroxin-11B